MLKNGETCFVFKKGRLSEIAENNKAQTIILFDEINLTSKEVLGQLVEIFDPNVN